MGFRGLVLGSGVPVLDSSSRSFGVVMLPLHNVEQLIADATRLRCEPLAVWKEADLRTGDGEERGSSGLQRSRRA